LEAPLQHINIQTTGQYYNCAPLKLSKLLQHKTESKTSSDAVYSRRIYAIFAEKNDRVKFNNPLFLYTNKVSPYKLIAPSFLLPQQNITLFDIILFHHI
jgi:hypothetical protein